MEKIFLEASFFDDNVIGDGILYKEKLVLPFHIKK